VPEKWPGMTGDRNLVRIGASAVGGNGCLEQRAVKARPAMWPGVRPRARMPRMNEFPLGLVMAALNDVEFGGRSRDQVLARLGADGQPVHPGASCWARHCIGAYLDGAVMISTKAVTPVRHHWIAQQSKGRKIWELFSWGRRYESADGTYREFRFIRYGAAGYDRDLAEVALAAYATAHGRLAPWPDPWQEPCTILSGAQVDVQYVRVLEVSLLDGSYKILFEGTPEAADDLYATKARDQVRAVSVGGPPQPGYDCADCKLVTACAELPRIPGALGITDPCAPLRTWSVSNGRYYSICPARDYLIRLNLPRENEYNSVSERGQAVHAWIEQNHAGPLRSGCTVWDTPAEPDNWTAGRWHVTGEQALAGARMLANHAYLCPFHRDDRIANARPEPVLAFHDTAANVIVTAKPDLVYEEDGILVWRETKTRQFMARPGVNLFADFPQVALATVLLAENALGGDPVGARIELELLAPDGGDVLLVDPNDPDELARARTAVRELAAPWHADELAMARPGPHCSDCPVRRWCPEGHSKEGR
jgi:PD-(D/E)XK nuclease superfamily